MEELNSTDKILLVSVIDASIKVFEHSKANSLADGLKEILVKLDLKEQWDKLQRL